MDINKLCMGCMKENGGEEVCPLCGYEKDGKNGVDELAQKHILKKRYLIGRVISRSCESIIYLAFDGANLCPVNVKEYFPQDVGKRNLDKTVTAEEEKEYAFNDGLLNFLELNKKLLDINLPSLFETTDVFEENGTAYAVRENALEGITLKQYIENNGGSLPWEQARPMFLPLIDTLSELNEAGIIHGGISPESLYVAKGGQLHINDILINRNRQADADMTAQIYGGYAALEQYEQDGMPLGTYTDVYGISATLFRTLIGFIPPEATERATKDSLSIPSHFAEELPRQVLVAIANGMQVSAQNRTQTVEKFNDELVYGETKENLKAAAKRKKENEKKAEKAVIIDDEEEIAEEKSSSSKAGVKTWLITALCTVGVFLVIGAILLFTVFRGSVFGKKEESSSKKEESSMPSIASIGEFDPEAVESKVDYTVPDFKGKYFKDIMNNEEYKHFICTVAAKEFSDSVPKGTVCAQSVEAGTTGHETTNIALTISLGPANFVIKNVTKMSESEAKL